MTRGDVVWCNIPSDTTTRGNSYYVRNCFAYRNNGHWDFFITLKNDYGYTVKMNAIRFRKRHHNIPQLELIELRLSKLEKVANDKI